MGKRFQSFLKFNVYPMLAALLIGIVVLQFLPVSIPNPLRLFGLVSARGGEGLLNRFKVADGYQVSLFAKGLGNIRLMALTPGGDIIFSAPRSRIKIALGDVDGDGMSDGVKVLKSGLRQVHGVYLDGDWLYYAETHQVSRIKYDGSTKTFKGKEEVVLTGLPGGGGHWTRTVGKGPDGWFYVSVGSSCNVCIERHPWRASIVRFKPGVKGTLYAGGLRNTVGFDWHPGSGALFGVDNGRDWLGDDYPPGELNKITDGGFYGWPFRNGNNKPDPDYGKQGGALAARAIKPAHGFAAHVAPLSIKFLKNAAMGGVATALVAQHGSWNRSTKIGYRVVLLHWDDVGAISQKMFLEGFEKDGNVGGRPVDIVEAGDGTIYISDDFSASIWAVKPTR